jgi:predicted transglutaminase-like cysteine proteinase
MKKSIKLLPILGVVAGALWHATAEAQLPSYPRPLGPQFRHLQLREPALPPLAHARFCLRYPQECEVRHGALTADGITMSLSEKRWAELAAVNSRVNRIIAPERDDLGVAFERWLIAPARGDCNDYAVTKRHELLDRGWPSAALLLAEVVTAWGEHHLVLVVRTEEGDFIADNLSAVIRPWYGPRYKWVRVQSPGNPIYWSTVAKTVI